jgi:cysteinylglycine-S-conjugate dipeptidase
MPRSKPTRSELQEAVRRELPRGRAELERLVRVPGIAFDGFDPRHLEESADLVAELMRAAGLDVRIVRAEGQPAVIGRKPGPPGSASVLLYAHHDVQPAGDRAAWDSDPFDPVEREGRLYGRGAADDKAGIVAHLVALRALGEALSVGVAVFVEGEEEFGSASLPELLRRHRDDLAADVIVICDSSNWDVGVPALTTSLRGMVNCYVELRVLRDAVHSGTFGGAVPDALTALSRLLASLQHSDGSVAVAGLASGRAAAAVDRQVEHLRAEAGVLDGVSLIGAGRIVDRLWAMPAISVLGIDAPSTDEAANALVPSAKAKVSLRLAPGDDADKAYAALRDHLEAHTPWGASITVTLEAGGSPCSLDTSTPAHRAALEAFRVAWDGTEPVEVGVGGTIPFIPTFTEQFPEAAILVTGVEDPYTQAHGPNESLHLGEFARVCLAEALLLDTLGARGADPAP